MVAVAEVMDDREVALENDGGMAIPGMGETSADTFHLADRADELVEKIAVALRGRIGEDRYDLWFERKTQMALTGNPPHTLLVETGNTFAVGWIGNKFRGELLAVARAVVGREMEVVIRVGEAARNVRPAVMSESAVRVPVAIGPANVRDAANGGSAVHLKHTLEEYVVGPTNQLAYHAALRVAEMPGGGQQFNPLFLHGHCGLGKTHLLQGICQRFGKLHPGKKWLYITGEQFTNDFLESIRAHKTSQFRRRLRNADLLVIDDVHFLANKKATQEEFLHTFNQIDASGKQIVLASDCAPRQIEALSEQLRSRFISGMVLRVDSPDLPTRLEILRRKVMKNGWNINDTVLMHIARTATSSVREMEGLLLQVVAGVRLINSGSGEAASVLASIRERTAMRGPIPAGRIVTAVAEHFAISEGAIMGSGREKIVSAARAVAMHLAREHTGMSYPEIGRALGNKNHSTVIAACQRIEGMIGTGELLCWQTPGGAKNQAISDILHDLEGAVRRVR